MGWEGRGGVGVGVGEGWGGISNQLDPFNIGKVAVGIGACKG